MSFRTGCVPAPLENTRGNALAGFPLMIFAVLPWNYSKPEGQGGKKSKRRRAGRKEEQGRRAGRTECIVHGVQRRETVDLEMWRADFQTPLSPYRVVRRGVRHARDVRRVGRDARRHCLKRMKTNERNTVITLFSTSLRDVQAASRSSPDMDRAGTRARATQNRSSLHRPPWYTIETLCGSAFHFAPSSLSSPSRAPPSPSLAVFHSV